MTVPGMLVMTREDTAALKAQKSGTNTASGAEGGQAGVQEVGEDKEACSR